MIYIMHTQFIFHSEHDLRYKDQTANAVNKDNCFLFLLFCTLTNQSTIISQIIVMILHVSTPLCHLQGARTGPLCT